MPPDPKPPTPLSTDAAVAGSPTRRAPDHDHGYKLLFSHAEMVRDLLTGFVAEPWLDEIAFDTLERVSGTYISDDLRDREDDIIWRAQFRGGWLYLYILLEFQSRAERFMATGADSLSPGTGGEGG